MINKKILIDYLENLLQPGLFQDITYNGLQLDGKDEIKNVGFSVDCSLEIFKKCFEMNIDFLITHHALIWRGWNKINSMNKKRLDYLFKNDTNLYVSHLPLDANQEIGNNIELCRVLNLEKIDSFAKVGVVGKVIKQLNFENFIILIKEKINNNIKYFKFNVSEFLDKIAICSGTLSESYLEEAYNKKIDTVLCGDGIEEILFYTAKENNINIIFAGHYHTEKFGILALMNKIKNDFSGDLNLFYLF